jgi:hypothetical protein
MNLWKALARPPWRTVVAGFALLVLVWLGYLLWTPGRDITDGRHDLGRNGIWLQHGWLADDDWFVHEKKTNQIARFRDPQQIQKLAGLLRQNHITDVFPHLCPAGFEGRLPSMDNEQAERFLREFKDFRVMPWVGGVLNLHVRLKSPEWRATFATNLRQLMDEHPAFAGVHLNVEPLPSGDRDFLALLEAIRAALPPGKVISVAAYPPPTRWQPSADVHWDEAYFRQVAARVDQIVVMMYDTSLKNRKLYESLAVSWTCETLSWSGGKPVLLGLPAYKDPGVDYHDPGTENLANALLGIHGGLIDFKKLPPSYQGIAIYSEWEMANADWETFRGHFLRKSP